MACNVPVLTALAQEVKILHLLALQNDTVASTAIFNICLPLNSGPDNTEATILFKSTTLCGHQGDSSQHFLQAIRLGAQEVQMQAWGGSAGRLYSVGLDLAAIDARIVVKLPITAAGVEATGLLKAKNVRTTLTGNTLLVTVSSIYAH